MHGQMIGIYPPELEVKIDNTPELRMDLTLL